MLCTIGLVFVTCINTLYACNIVQFSQVENNCIQEILRVRSGYRLYQLPVQLLQMCILFHNDHQEHNTLVCTVWFMYFWCTLLNAWYVQTTPQDFFIFCTWNTLSSIYTEDKSGGNDLKATGGVETFAC